MKASCMVLKSKSHLHNVPLKSVFQRTPLRDDLRFETIREKNEKKELESSSLKVGKILFEKSPFKVKLGEILKAKRVVINKVGV